MYYRQPFPYSKTEGSTATLGAKIRVEMGDEKIRIRRLEHYDLHGRVRLAVAH
jgi:hypothetical protein